VQRWVSAVSAVSALSKKLQRNTIWYNYYPAPIDEFQQTPSVEFTGNFTLLGVWKVEFQCKYAANQNSQMNLKYERV
jgi:hypothetical protein